MEKDEWLINKTEELYNVPDYYNYSGGSVLDYLLTYTEVTKP